MRHAREGRLAGDRRRFKAARRSGRRFNGACYVILAGLAAVFSLGEGACASAPQEDFIETLYVGPEELASLGGETVEVVEEPPVQLPVSGALPLTAAALERIRFEYYRGVQFLVSSDIVLSKIDGVVMEVLDNGQRRLLRAAGPGEVVIPQNSLGQGVGLRRYYANGQIALDVCFEYTDDRFYLTFANDPSVEDSPFSLRLSAASTVRYGDAFYSVRFSGNALPCLLFIPGMTAMYPALPADGQYVVGGRPVR